MNTESVIVPGGCTMYIQTSDVLWNKPFKSRIAEFFDEWLHTGNISTQSRGRSEGTSSVSFE